MDKNPMPSQALSPNPETEAGADRARIALRAAQAMLLPLARWLLRHGVPYTAFAAALKPVFVEAARRELEGAGARLTDSALSVLSGVHRRDIRASGRGEAAMAGPKSPSVVSQVFTRWVTDPDWRDAAGRPLALPKLGPARSFDSLARQVSSDVHPRTLLAEMLRLGLAEQEGETVRLCMQAFLPQQDLAASAAMFSAHIADHIAAVVHNLAAGEGRYLEQSMYGSRLTPASVAALGESARQLWASAFEQIVREATRHYEADRELPEAGMRMRFGVYYYAEPEAPGAARDSLDGGAR
jgi:hypothetical protein